MILLACIFEYLGWLIGKYGFGMKCLTAVNNWICKGGGQGAGGLQ